MSLSFGQNEPLSCPKNAIFGGLIGVYFFSFFLEHPVVNQDPTSLVVVTLLTAGW